MNIVNKLYGISLLSLLLSAAACTNETEEPHKGSGTGTSPDAPRREVMLTLKNKLSVLQTKAGDEIATAAENKISALDIYVFGSKTEDGNYTYQERFCYRENISDIPVGGDITAIDLTAVGSDGKQTTALLSLKKGLFVKLYCIANQSKLINSTTNAVFSNFVPLMQSNPGQVDNTVTEGSPTEHDFKLLRSVQLDPATATDILVTPLPMTGAYTTPLDLTDFSVSARLQLGFRLTRSVARFDIVNDAATSRFTIQSVSMANGRKGVSLFPLKVTGTLPAAGGDLITYPARPFDGEKANEGTCTGAFYTWPSPVEDGGYLILSGTYATNQTENTPVTYKVPFKPEGDGNYIEVSQNHRYTVNITAADEYHLDFTIDVADWTDEGNIDDYEPGGETDKNGMKINITGDNGTYDADTRTVTMAITNGAQFTIEGGSTYGYFTTLYYENGDVDHQWLTMDPKADNMPTKAEAIQKYTIKKNDSYLDTKYPVAFIRFTEKISAKETVVIVQPIANPVVKEKTISNGSTINVDAGEIVLYQSSSVASPTVTFSVFASGGSELVFPDGDTPGNWLTVSPATEQGLSQSDYTLTLNTIAADFPDPFPVGGKTINIVNKGDETKKTTLTLKLKSDITVTSSAAGQAELDGSEGLRLYNNGSDNIKLTVNTIGGSEMVNAPAWVTVTKENENKNQTTYTIAPNGIGTNAEFSIRSRADNMISKIYKVYSISPDITYSGFSASESRYTTISGLTTSATSPTTITYFPCSGATAQFIVTSPKGVVVSNTTNWAETSETEKNLSTGQKQTIFKVVRGSGYSDTDFAAINKSNLSVTITDKYSNNKKVITIKQYTVGIVFPGSKVPANSVSGNGRFWVAGENGYQNGRGYVPYNSLMDWINRGTACPLGWRVPSKQDYVNLANISDLEAKVNKITPWGSYTQLKTAFIGYLYWASDGKGRGFLTDSNNGFGMWDLGRENAATTYRCIKNY